jgi:outer membrane murein-binding lipoprotein Lpp
VSGGNGPAWSVPHESNRGGVAMRWLQFILVFVVAVLLALGGVGVNAFEHTTHTVNQLSAKVDTLEHRLSGSEITQLTKQVNALKQQEHATQLYAQGISTQLYQAEQGADSFNGNLVNCIDQNQTIITDAINTNTSVGIPAIIADGSC